MRINQSYTTNDNCSYQSLNIDDAINKWSLRASLDLEHSRAVRKCVMKAINDLNKQERTFRILDLSDFQLTSLPPALVIKQLQGINILDLSGNNLHGSELEKLNGIDSLHQLHLSCNPLEYIPHNALSHMKNLKILNVDECNLYEFPGGILELHDLGTLNLRGNPLNTLPGFLGYSIFSLGVLDIRDTGIVEIPVSIKTLDKLTIKK